MKKYVISFLFIIFLVNVIYGLDYNYGFKAGWNYAFLNGDGFESNYPLYGYLGGFFGEFSFNKYTAMQTGIFFSKKGGTIGVELNSKQVNIDYGLSYLEIPLEFTVLRPINDIWKLKLNLGGYSSYKIDDEFQIQTGDVVTKTEIEIENFDYGFLVGLGGVFFQQYSLDIKYQRGLTDIFIEYPDYPNVNYDIYNNTVSIIVGFYLL